MGQQRGRGTIEILLGKWDNKGEGSGTIQTRGPVTGPIMGSVSL